jgi:hypothetical protein
VNDLEVNDLGNNHVLEIFHRGTFHKLKIITRNKMCSWQKK